MGPELKNCRWALDEKGVAVLTIDREDVRNALDAATWEDLERFIDFADLEPAVKAVVLTGAGRKCFASGADLRMMFEKKSADVLGGSSQRVANKIETCGKAVVCALNGHAFGGGFEIALACDIRVIAAHAMLGLPETGLGILPGVGGSQRLARVVGMGRAKEIILAGRNVTAQEAVDWGLAYQCVPYEELMDAAKKVASAIASKGPLAIRLAKRAIRAALSTDQESGMLLEMLCLSVLCGSEDKDEGVRAFLEKRAPTFKGR